MKGKRTSTPHDKSEKRHIEERHIEERHIE
jgi:hypothetical protein